MPRRSTGSVYEKPPGSGNWYGAFTTATGRKSVRLQTCSTREAAEARKDFIAGQIRRLRDAQRDEFIDKLLELAAPAPEMKLPRVERGIVQGEFERPPTNPQGGLDAGMTFREFAEKWTSGELHQRWPDYVKLNATATDDEYRLKKHVYDFVGDTPLSRFTLERADMVMRPLPADLSAASRCHVAQLLHRVLELAR